MDHTDYKPIGLEYSRVYSALFDGEPVSITIDYEPTMPAHPEHPAAQMEIVWCAEAFGYEPASIVFLGTIDAAPID